MSANIYLDDAATGRMLPEVGECMKEIMAGLVSGEIGNPASLHTPGQRGKEILEDTRVKVASLVGAEPREIIFTSGGSEANNTVMRQFAGRKILVSSIEHPSVLNSARKYAGELAEIPVDERGRIDEEEFAKILKQEQPDLVSVMWANNELGTVQEIAKLAEMAHLNGAKFHTDATQAVGKIPISIENIDFLTFSAHKLGGPVGIGALYVRGSKVRNPLIYGGEQEGGRRAGTSNALLAGGFCVAAEAARENLGKWDRVRVLRDELQSRILAEVPYSSSNTPAESLPGILNMSFQAAEGESIQLMLDAQGIAVSTGSACASGSLAPDHVLMATHHDAERAHSSVRFSLGLNTSRDEINNVMEVLPGIVTKLQGISTIKTGEQNG